MPYKHENKPIADYFIDGRTRMLPCQKERCLQLYSDGMGIRALARLFHVDKRLIQFLLFPDRKKKNLDDRAKRGGTKKYYDKEKHRLSMKAHRNKKSSLPPILFNPQVGQR